MDRRNFESLAYVQSGNYCVLASYASALWPWLRATPLSYFVAYCEHFGLSPDPRCAEATYLADFVVRYSQPGMSGYKVIQSLHETSNHSIFVRARAAVSHTSYADVTTNAAKIEQDLLGYSESALMAFVNSSRFGGLSGMHSISIIRDVTFYHFDANVGCLQPSAASLSDLGSLGEGLYFVGKIPITKSA